MKKLLKIGIFVLFLCATCAFSSCGGLKHEGRKLQKTLLRQQTLAERKAEELAHYLQHPVPAFDSIRALTNDANHIYFYIFDHHRMVYWSDNRLSSDEVRLREYDTWTYYRFHNAHVVGYWTKADNYNILTLIPIKAAYPFEALWLHNRFLPPFEIDPNYDVTRVHNSDFYEITSTDGTYLFSLSPTLLSPSSTIARSPLSGSFSFQQLYDSQTDAAELRSARARVRLYFMSIIVLFSSLLIVGIVGLIRSRGFGNMRLRTRFIYVIMTCVLLCFVYIFLMSIGYAQTNYEQRQREMLQAKCKYIQTYLQSLYYWDISLTADNASGLHIDLRDIGFSAGVDIHVFDSHGKLVGSSTPGLFSEGLLSTRMAPEPFFSDEKTMVQYEQFGDTRYLCAYTPFYNGSFVQIGYIAVPSFVSQIQASQEVDNLLARLLPPYLIVLFLSLFASYWVARGMTAPLSALADKMRHFRIGNPDNHILYRHHDELGDLVERYNAMVDQVEESAALLARAEREGAWRTMARQIAHEINNSLTPMKLTIQQLQRTKGTERFDTYFAKSTQMLIDEVDHLSRIAASFSTFAKQPEVTAAEVDVAQRLSQVVQLFRHNEENVPIRYVGPDHSVLAWTDGEQIAQVFTNIIRNALQAMEGRPHADIIVILKEPHDSDMVEISFSDNGPGIPPEVQARVFMPNFTTKNTGMGLGLAISKNIVEATGGKICFETSEKGTTFFVYLRKKP